MKTRPWYGESLYAGMSREVILRLGRGGKLEGTANTRRAVAHLVERGLASAVKKTELTCAGRKLYLSQHLGIRPVSLLVLAAVYARITYAGVYVKSFGYFESAKLTDAQLRHAFNQLASKDLIFRRRHMALFWHIRKATMKKLDAHRAVLLDIDGEMHK